MESDFQDFAGSRNEGFSVQSFGNDVWNTSDKTLARFYIFRALKRVIKLKGQD